MYGQHKLFLILSLFTVVLSLFYLMASLLHLSNPSVESKLETLPFPIFTIILTILLIVIERKKPLPLRSLRGKCIYVIPGLMSPMALLNAWTLSPSHLGAVAWGGTSYFLESVFRYPNFGSINSEVFIGIVAVLCTSYLPFVIAWGYLLCWPKRKMYVLALIAVFAYLSVALHLDFNLWLAGLYGSELESLVFLLYGPISRTLAIISTCYIIIKLIFSKPQSKVSSSNEN